MGSKPKTKPEIQETYTPEEVGRLFGVCAKTVTRWSRDGKIPAIRTLGGHRRYLRSTVDAMLAEESN